MKIPEEDVLQSVGRSWIGSFVGREGRVDTKSLCVRRERKGRLRCEGGYIKVDTYRDEG